MKVRINLANHAELMSLPEIGPEQADAIIQWRAQHGPIADEAQLHRVLGDRRIHEGLLERIDFEPSDSTAPEAPGA